MNIMKNKNLTIAILTYNRLEFLKQTILSVLRSYRDNVEIIVFDNASNDGTLEYLLEMSQSNKLRYFRHDTNIGMGGNANFILQNINSDYLLMLHDDDLISEHYIDEIVSFINDNEDNDIVMIGTGYHLIDSSSQNKPNSANVFTRNDGCSSYVLGSKEYLTFHINGSLSLLWSGTVFNVPLVKEHKFDFTRYKYAADAFFMLDILQDYKIGYISKDLFQYREHSLSTTSSFNLNEILSEWSFNFNYYREYLIRNGYESLIPAHQATTNRLLLGFIGACENFGQLKTLLSSDYFRISKFDLIQLNQFVKQIIKFLIKRFI